MNGRGCAPVKLYLKNHAADWIWPVVCSLLTPDLGPINTIHLLGKLNARTFTEIVVFCILLILNQKYFGNYVNNNHY